LRHTSGTFSCLKRRRRDDWDLDPIETNLPGERKKVLCAFILHLDKTLSEMTEEEAGIDGRRRGWN
jgi:hypothetical protein